jgi:two-component system phosphate regulon response regulator PhoB
MQLSKHRILYIEDHEDIRDMVTIVLEQQNYEVITAATMAGGVGLATKEHFDLYLLDSRLPDGSGVDLCRELRSFDQRTPILFYSAAAYEVDKKIALDCGAQGYLIKPSANGDLCKLVETLISGAPDVGTAGQVH